MKIVSNGSTVIVGDGVSVPPGGLTGQVLVKASDTDYDAKWVDYGDIVETPEPDLPVHIYGAEWDGSATTAWTRTDGASDFIDPNPAVSAGGGSSPFDNIMPWSGMVRVTDPDAGELVAIPKFWFKWTQNGNGLKLQIANQETEGFYVSPAHMDRGDGHGERDVVYVGRYHCGPDYKSTTDVEQKVNITRSSARESIHTLGDDIWQWDMAMHVSIQMLYLVEFADWNSQATIGYGCSPTKNKENNGKTDTMAYHTGTKAVNRETYGFTQYRHIEGLWDNVFDWLDGCYYNSNGLNLVKNPDNFSDSEGGTAVGVPSNGFPTVMAVATQLGLEWVIYPIVDGGSTRTYVPDNWEFITSLPCLYAGGNYGQSQYSGLFYVGYEIATGATLGVGCRLQKLPNN